MNNLSGTCIKGYELQEQIGVGGFGVVWAAEQKKLGVSDAKELGETALKLLEKYSEGN